LREVAGALGGNQDQRAAAVRHEATLQWPDRVGDHPGIEHILDLISYVTELPDDAHDW